jgi:pyruvate formate lyase activating enzyme
MLGCDFHCAYCQNWITSQTLRDANATARPYKVTIQDIITSAHRDGARILTSTYNEPLITSEWAVEIFKHGRGSGLYGSYVSNGNATPEVLEYIRPWVDFYKVDLKGYDDAHYRKLGGVLANIQEGIGNIHKLGFWMEVVTLLIPGFNDSDEEIRKLCDFLVSVSPDIPWHATAFHADYKMSRQESTSVETLLKAARIGKQSGLKFVYLGNKPGNVGDWENTYCPDCHAELVKRMGFRVLENTIVNGACPKCLRKIPGRWEL